MNAKAIIEACWIWPLRVVMYAAGLALIAGGIAVFCIAFAIAFL